MLRIHLLQQWFKLSDPLVEEVLIATPCFRRFAGIETMEERIPDETTILHFRHLLEEHRTAEQILEGVSQMLQERGVMLREGTILDATNINAASSTKNKRKERDPEMHSVAKGKQWFHCCAEGFANGMRCPIGIEKHGEVQGCQAEFRTAMKPGQRRIRPETPEGRLLNLIETAKVHLRAKVVHPFRIINYQFGFRKVFYRGIRLPSPEGERGGATRTISN